MTQIPLFLEGELLIRAILHGRKGSSSSNPSNALRISGLGSLSSAIPQIAGKSGFQHLDIILHDTGSCVPLPESFLWHGANGTQVSASIKSAGSALDETVCEGVQISTLTRIWYGELPISREAAPCTVGYNRHRLAEKLIEAEFLSIIEPSNPLHNLEAELQAAWAALLQGYAQEPTRAKNEEHLNTISEIERISAIAITELGNATDTRGLKRPVLVFNSHSFYANEVVMVKLESTERPVTAIGPEGEAEQVQILENRDGEGVNYAIYVAKNVPLSGYAVWDLGATLVPTESDDAVTVSPTHLENSSIRIEFDHATGLILKIFDKDGERDLLNEAFEVQRNGRRDLLLQSCANLFEVSGANGAPRTLTHLDKAEVIENGPVRGAIRFTRILPDRRSMVRQTVRLTARSTRIDFVTEIDWHEEDGSLSVSFPVAINSSRATYESPFGYIERPTYSNNLDVAKKQEVSCHSWVDLSEGDYGVALLNDFQCSCEVTDNTMRLHLPASRSSTDLEFRRRILTYSLFPHGGDLREGEVIENSLAVSIPPTCSPIVGNKPGKLPLERSFFEVDSASVFISSIKRAANEENAIIVRLYEAHNTRGMVLLTTTLQVKSAWLCDLMENNLAEIPLDHGEALLPFHPFEIVTVKYML